MDMPPERIYFDITEHGCSFMIGEEFTAHRFGTCSVESGTMEDPMNVTMSLAHMDEVHHFFRVDDFDAGEDEPVAVRKWTDGDAMAIWELPPEEETDMMFFWDGFHLMDMGP